MLLLEDSLKERRCRAYINDSPRFFERLHMLMIVRDQISTGIAPAGKLAYFVASVEDEL